MKISHVWSVLCGQSVINSDNNVISLFNILENLDINVMVKEVKDMEKEINVQAAYELVSYWINMSDSKEVKGFVDVSVKDPKNVERHLFSNEFIIPENTKKLRTRLKIAGIVVKESGIYNFIVKIREVDKDKPKEVASIPLEIVINRKLEPEKLKKTT